MSHRFCVPLFIVLVTSASFVRAADIPDDSPVATILRRADKSVKAIVDVPGDKRTFDNTVGAIDDLIASMYRDAAFDWFMSIVSTDSAQRDRGRRASKDLDDWFVYLLKREDLYEAVNAYADTKPKLVGERKRLLLVPNYNFDWQQSYRWKAGTVFFPRGTRIQVDAHFDNSAFNPFNPDPERVVPYGRGTEDEMMIGFFFYLRRGEDLQLRIDPSNGHVIE